MQQNSSALFACGVCSPLALLCFSIPCPWLPSIRTSLVVLTSSSLLPPQDKSKPPSAGTSIIHGLSWPAYPLLVVWKGITCTHYHRVFEHHSAHGTAQEPLVSRALPEEVGRCGRKLEVCQAIFTACFLSTSCSAEIMGGEECQICISDTMTSPLWKAVYIPSNRAKPNPFSTCFLFCQ